MPISVFDVEPWIAEAELTPRWSFSKVWDLPGEQEVPARQGRFNVQIPSREVTVLHLSWR